MASVANTERVFRNFIWRLESVTPAGSVAGIGKARFTHLGLRDIDPAAAPGLAQRGFLVFATGGDADHAVGGDTLSDGLNNRIGSHSFRVEVYYNAKLPHFDLHRAILLDAHDTTYALRNPANFVGFDSDNTSTDIGLYSRERVGYEVERGDDYWTYAAEWRCVINEPEI